MGDGDVVAYSFKKQFVNPILVGLGLERHIHTFEPLPPPKRQTIRAHRRRHARAGEELQLFHAQRTKECFLIGRARCVSASGIRIQFGLGIISIDDYPAIRDGDLDPFAQSDGFANFEEMKEFWRQEHPRLPNFDGVIIKWEPLS